MFTNFSSYADIVGEKENWDDIVVRFNDYNSNFLISECYCMNPACSCEDVVLRFFELSGEGEPLEKWFTIRLDTSTWEISEKELCKDNILTSNMIKEFEAGLEGLKETLRDHFLRSREYARRNSPKQISEDTETRILNKEVVPYSDLFGDKDADVFHFTYNETENWFIADQYCSNPLCNCSEAILTFYRIDALKEVQKGEFAVRMNVNTLAYEIEFSVCGSEMPRSILHFLQNRRPEWMQKIKSRYAEVKRAARDIANRRAACKEEDQVNAKIGRNDLCPCGSGKKYKKCCGR